MKGTLYAVIMIMAATAITPTAYAERFSKLKPEYYHFTYKYRNNRIIEDTVCDRYSGLDWKGCRRYANWFFSKKCWEYRYELRTATGSHREDVRKKKHRFCDAKRRITPL